MLQEQIVKEQQDRATERLSQRMQAEVDSTRQQAVDATQLAAQAQYVVQVASMTVSAYEPEMNEIQHTVAQLQ